MKLLFLGTGGSLGVPAVGCFCPVCTSDDPRNKRMRPSLLIQYEDKNILIDTATEFRLQAVRHELSRIDAIIYTHAHADHILGIDDLRIVAERMQSQIPVFGTEETLSRIREMFAYAFEQRLWRSDITRLRTEIIKESFDVLGLTFEPIPVMHDTLPVNGYRFGDVAYVTDVSYIPPESMEKLEGLKLLIISAIRFKPHPKHMAVDEVLGTIEKLKPEKALITHISHELEHSEFDRYCPDNVSPAYDGLHIEL